MRWSWLLPLCLVVLAAAQESDSSEEEAALPLAEPCDPEACKLPNCRCSSTDIPGNLQARDTPQVKLYITYVRAMVDFEPLISHLSDMMMGPSSYIL